MAKVLSRSSFVWKTKEGREIPLSQIEDSHLQNIINFLKKELKSMETVLETGGWVAGPDDEWYDIDEDEAKEEIAECQRLIKFLEREQILRLAGV